MRLYLGCRNFFIFRLGFICPVFVLIGCGGGSSDDNMADVANKFSIVSTTPGGEMGGVLVDAQLKIEFSHNVDPVTMSSRTFTLLNVNTHLTASGQISLDENTKIATLQPNKKLDYGTHYKATVSHFVTNTAGDHLGQSHSWSFFTAEQPPTKDFFQPPEGDTGVSVKTNVRAHFSQPINPATANNRSFQIKSMDGKLISGQISVENNDSERGSSSSVVLKPTQELALNTQYQVTLTASITGLSDVAIEPLSWSFTTSPNHSAAFQFGTTEIDEAHGVASDADGNVIVVGRTQGNFEGVVGGGAIELKPSDDIFVVKFDSGGKQLWAQQFGTEEFDSANDVVLDRLGNIYLAGHTDGSLDGSTVASLSDVFMMKLDSNGNQLWVRQYGSPEGHEIAHAIDMDAAGNLYVTGDSSGNIDGLISNGKHDIFIFKMDADGNKIWSRLAGSGDQDHGNDIAVTAEGDIFVSGETEGSWGAQSSLGFSTAIVLKLNTEGAVQWTYLANFEYGIGISIDTDSAGNAYFVGAGYDPNMNSGGMMDGRFLAKLDGSGRLDWMKFSDSQSPGELAGFTIDGQDNLYIAVFEFSAGNFFPPSLPFQEGPPTGGSNRTLPNLIAKKYDTNGDLVSQDKVSVTEYAAPTGIIYDEVSKHSYLTGGVNGSIDGNVSLGLEDAYLVKFSATEAVSP